MSEDRTQPASKRRRQLAREHGQVAHSPELSAAAGWLVAVVLFTIVGDDLTLGLTKIVHGSLIAPSVVTPDRAAVVAQVRGLFLSLGWPLAAILAGFAAGALAAHQIQVRGLCATALIAPSPRRLWALASGPGLAHRAERMAWSTFKAGGSWRPRSGRFVRAGVSFSGWADSRHRPWPSWPGTSYSSWPVSWRRSCWCWV